VTEPLGGDDCQIFALLGREILGWGEKAPDTSQFAVFYRPDEGGGYVEQCPWAQLGITPLPPGEPDRDNMRYFTQPKYDEGGRAMAPYINQANLTLRKIGGRWTLTAREQGPMT
jgi:hypothetical protein